MTDAGVERTVAFVDLAGFTALTEAMGDSAAVSLLERFTALTRESMRAGDELVKEIGDAVMLASASPQQGLTLVEGLFGACFAEPDFPLPRAGLHHGPVVERGADYFGATVNLAARIAGQAHGGQVLASAPVAEAAREHGLDVVDLGQFGLRNLSGPVELWEIRLGVSDDAAGIDPVCRMRVSRDDAAGRLRFESHDYWFCSLACAATFASSPDPYVTAHD